MIEGCLLWQECGLHPPQAVIDATEAYFSAEDAVGRWISEWCELKGNFEEPVAVLFASFKKWAELMSEPPLSSKAFSTKLAGRPGIRRDTKGHNKVAYFFGIRTVKEEPEQRDWTRGE
jgi:putative DNA primase/helicase